VDTSYVECPEDFIGSFKDDEISKKEINRKLVGMPISIKCEHAMTSNLYEQHIFNLEDALMAVDQQIICLNYAKKLYQKNKNQLTDDLIQKLKHLLP